LEEIGMNFSNRVDRHQAIFLLYRFLKLGTDESSILPKIIIIKNRRSKPSNSFLRKTSTRPDLCQSQVEISHLPFCAFFILWGVWLCKIDDVFEPQV
jgi:hypothetical protein